MKQVQVPLFEPILCQNVATASIHLLECLPASKTANKSGKCEKCLGALCAAGQHCGAIYTGRMLHGSNQEASVQENQAVPQSSILIHMHRSVTALPRSATWALDGPGDPRASPGPPRALPGQNIRIFGEYS